MIYHFTPWLTGNIGGGINACIQLLPDDAWVCLRDGDTSFLSPQWGAQVEAIVAEHGDTYDLIGAMTNRIRAPYQLHEGVLSEEADLSRHVAIASERWAEHLTAVAPVPYGPIAGFLMLFRKSTWARHPFAEHSVFFDRQFTDAVRRRGGRVGVAQGLYLLHMYRWGKPEPIEYLDHLRGVHP